MEQIRQATNVRELLYLQKVLDNHIKEKSTEKLRKRKFRDVVVSAIAEIIEMNEASEFSHKTWKPVEFNEVEFQKELIDVSFFLAQLINYIEELDPGMVERNIEDFEKAFDNGFRLDGISPLSQYYLAGQKDQLVEHATRVLIRDFNNLEFDGKVLKNICELLQTLTSFYEMFGVKKEMFFEIHWNKWNYNMGRSEKNGDWNNNK